ncbi:MAG: ParA family protein [Gallionella sp.]
MKTLAFFNPKSRFGKTTLVYHLAWMLADKGIDTLVLDLDPQATLTSLFLPEERLAQLWRAGDSPDTISGAIAARMRGEVAPLPVEQIADHLTLGVGDPNLACFESAFAEDWLTLNAGGAVMTAFHQLIARTPHTVVLLDLGGNLGAINRAALLAADQIMTPLVAERFAPFALQQIGASLEMWRTEWQKRLLLCSADTRANAPQGKMQPSGYMVIQRNVRDRWLEKLPAAYQTAMYGEANNAPLLADDPHKLASLRYEYSLIQLATEARKPMFFLKSADGAVGSSQEAVRSCYQDFEQLAAKIAANAGIAFPNS